MSFDSLRKVVDERMFGKSNTQKHDYSPTDNTPGLAILEDNKIRIVREKGGKYEELDMINIYRDGEVKTNQASAPYIKMLIHDVAVKSTTFGWKNKTSNGFIRFQILLNNATPEKPANPEIAARLIADAIDKRICSVKGTDDSLKNSIYIYTGTLNKTGNTDSEQSYNVDFQYEYYN